MLLLTSLRVTYPTAPSSGSWFVVDAPPGIINLKVNLACGAYTLGSQVGATDNPNVQFNCPSIAGIYKFEYRVAYCGTIVTYRLSVNVTESVTASIEEVYSGSPCTASAIIVDTTSSTQALQAIWANDSFTPSIHGRLVITDDCGSPTNTTSFNIATSSIVTLLVPITITDYTGYIKTIRLKNSTTTFNIDVSPTSPYLSFTGSPYTVDPAHLLFSMTVFNSNTYRIALQNVLLNAIHSLTGAQINLAPFGVSTDTNLVKLTFTSKNVPNATYTGMDHLDTTVITYQGGTNVTSSSGAGLRNLTIVNIPITATGTTSCGNEISVTNTLAVAPANCLPNAYYTIALPVNGAPYSFNVNYNVINFGTFRLDTEACSATGDFTCPGASLTLKAVTSPPCPNATYVWSTSATTQTIVPTTGTYSVTITCDTCSDTASITI